MRFECSAYISETLNVEKYTYIYFLMYFLFVSMLNVSSQFFRGVINALKLVVGLEFKHIQPSLEQSTDPIADEYPTLPQARIAADLAELRNQSVFIFFMCNALYCLIVFLLQLNKDNLHVNWPLGVKYNITLIEETGQVCLPAP